MMDFTREQLEKIISEAPDDATHIAKFIGVEYFWVSDSGSVVMWSNGAWSTSIFTPRTKLSDLAEKLQEMKIQESKQAEIDNTAQQVESGGDWKNGDECYIENCSHDEVIFIGFSKNKAVAICECITEERKVITDKFLVCDLLKEKPLTPEQKQQQIDEKNRLEAAYDLYCDYCEYACSEVLGFHEFRCKVYIAAVWLSIADKTNYRKDESI